MTSRVSQDVDLRQGFGQAVQGRAEPGGAEGDGGLQEMLGRAESSNGAIRLERLKQAVYRLRVGDGPGRALVIKRHTPVIAQTDRLVAERWLPALGFEDRCPQLLAAAAEREGRWTWHIYEDLGHDNLAAHRLPWRLEAAVDFIAELHTRAAGHSLVPEIRCRARDHGVPFFLSNLRDAIDALDALAGLPRDAPPEFPAARTRLRDRLHTLLEDAPRRVRLMEEHGGPDTLLHGDLWPKNIFVSMNATAPHPRLIDWDHVGAGPFSYDVSTLLYQSSPGARPRMLRPYREAVARSGRRLPSDAELNLLFHTAQTAPYAPCILFDAMALLNDGAAWGCAELIAYEQWFEALRPPLPGES